MRNVSAPGRLSVLLVFQMSPVNAADMTHQLVHYSSAVWTSEVRLQAPSYQQRIAGFLGGKRRRGRADTLVLLSDSLPFDSVTLSEARGNAWSGLISSFHLKSRSTGCLDDQAAGGLKDQPAGENGGCLKEENPPATGRRRNTNPVWGYMEVYGY